MSFNKIKTFQTMLTDANAYLNSIFDETTFESVYNGDGGYIWNNKDVVYPSVCFEILSIQTTETTNVYNYRVTAANRQHESIESTTQNNYNMLFEMLETAFKSNEQPTEIDGVTFNIQSGRQYQFAPLKIMDVCAVATVDIAVVEYVGEC